MLTLIFFLYKENDFFFLFLNGDLKEKNPDARKAKESFEMTTFVFICNSRVQRKKKNKTIFDDANMSDRSVVARLPLLTEFFQH